MCELVKRRKQLQKHDLTSICFTLGRRYIRIENGSGIRFYPEEVFLFLMMKMRTSFTNKSMCDLMFGGNASIWSYGWLWILYYLDNRYQHIVGIRLFPSFFDAIQNYIMKPTTHHFNDGTSVMHSGISYLPQHIWFHLLLCLQDESSILSPQWRLRGAPRHPDHYIA